jgi:predicted secreted protein
MAPLDEANNSLSTSVQDALIVTAQPTTGAGWKTRTPAGRLILQPDFVIWLVGARLAHEHDHHLLGFFPDATWRRLIDDSGLSSPALMYLLGLLGATRS